MVKLGLIGGPLISKYSIAPKLWRAMLSVPLEYHVFGIHSSQELPKILNDNKFSGFSIAKPYKSQICKWINPADTPTKTLGIGNAVYNQDGQLFCINTDGYGCLDGMKLNGFKAKNSKTLIIGCGGAGASLAFTLTQKGGKVWVFDRDKRKTNSLLRKIHAASQIAAWDQEKTTFDAIVNATPCGMKIPGTNNHLKSPLHTSILKTLTARFFVEMNYNPFETIFLKNGKEIDAITVPGIYMLYFQAKRAAAQFGLGKKTAPFEYVLKTCFPQVEM